MSVQEFEAMNSRALCLATSAAHADRAIIPSDLSEFPE